MDLYNTKLNPAIFSFLAALKGFKPLDFKGFFTLFDNSEDSLNSFVVSSLYKNATVLTENLQNFDNVDIFSFSKNFSLLENQEEQLKIINTLTDESYLFFTFSSLPKYGDVVLFNRMLFNLAGEDEERLNLIIEAFKEKPSLFVFNSNTLKALLASDVKRFIKKEFSPKYFFEVYDELKRLSFSFVGRLDLYLNDPEISLFPSQVITVSQFKEEKDRQTLIDFILNIGLHQDLWYKGEKGNVDYSFIDENFFIIPRQYPYNLRRNILLPGGHKYPLSAPIFEPFYKNGEKPFRLSDHPDFKGNEDAILKAFYKVICSGEFFVCIDDTYLVGVEKITDELPENIEIDEINKVLLEKAFEKLSDLFLVSKATGGASVYLSNIEVILLKMAVEYGKSKAVEKAFEFLASIDKDIRIKGETKPTKEIKEEDLKTEFENLFKGRKAFNLQRLNILKV